MYSRYVCSCLTRGLPDGCNDACLGQCGSPIGTLGATEQPMANCGDGKETEIIHTKSPDTLPFVTFIPPTPRVKLAHPVATPMPLLDAPPLMKAVVTEPVRRPVVQTKAIHLCHNRPLMPNRLFPLLPPSPPTHPLHNGLHTRRGGNPIYHPFHAFLRCNNPHPP